MNLSGIGNNIGSNPYLDLLLKSKPHNPQVAGIPHARINMPIVKDISLVSTVLKNGMLKDVAYNEYRDKKAERAELQLAYEENLLQLAKRLKSFKSLSTGKLRLQREKLLEQKIAKALTGDTEASTLNLAGIEAQLTQQQLAPRVESMDDVYTTRIVEYAKGTGAGEQDIKTLREKLQQYNVSEAIIGGYNSDEELNAMLNDVGVLIPDTLVQSIRDKTNNNISLNDLTRARVKKDNRMKELKEFYRRFTSIAGLPEGTRSQIKAKMDEFDLLLVDYELTIKAGDNTTKWYKDLTSTIYPALDRKYKALAPATPAVSNVLNRLSDATSGAPSAGAAGVSELSPPHTRSGKPY